MDLRHIMHPPAPEEATTIDAVGYSSDSDLSMLSETPEPPDSYQHIKQNKPNYPTPPASQDTSQSGSPSPDDSSVMNSSDKDEQPPRKKRRVSERAPRTTEHLDLRRETIDPEQQPQLDRLLNVLHKRQKIVVIAGAGISVSAGIPDFRSSTGLFKSLRAQHNLKGSGKDLFDASVVYKDASSTSSFHDMVREMSKMTKTAKPTPFHHMLATLAQQDRLLRLYSQNVDGIDTALEPLKTNIPLKKESGKWPKTIQLHGGLDTMVCSKCNETRDFEPDLFAGPVPPVCTTCEALDRTRTELAGKRSHGVGMLRPRMVLYNEHNPDDEAIGSVCREDLRKRPDAVIVVGTTLKVPGVKRIVREMCATVRDRRDGVAIWINNDPQPSGKEFDDCWDIIVQGKCDDIATRAALGQWDRQNDSEEVLIHKSDNVAHGNVEVVIHPNFTFKAPAPGVTPMSSPERPMSSPLSSRATSIAPSDIFGASDAMAETPSKRKSKIAAKPTKATLAKQAAKIPFATMEKSKPAPVKKAAAPRRATKTSAVKAVPAKKAQPTKKAPAKPQQTIGFKTRKAVSSAAEKKLKTIEDSAMRPLGPEDVRRNSSSPVQASFIKSTISDSEEERIKVQTESLIPAS